VIILLTFQFDEKLWPSTTMLKKTGYC